MLHRTAFARAFFALSLVLLAPIARGAGQDAPAPSASVPSDPAAAQDLSIDVLRASIRPLTKAQVAEQLDGWLSLLQRECIEVREVEIAALQSDDAEQVAEFNELAVAARATRGRLIERVEVLIDALEDKNGDVDDARAYVESVVVTPPISGWRATWSRTRAWLMSADGGVDLGLRLLRAFGVLAVFWILGRVCARLARAAVSKMHKVSELLRGFVVLSTRRLIVFLGFVFAASQLGFNMGPLLAIIGAAGLVIGLALQGTLSNFASGLLIMIYRPFDIGDLIQVGTTLGKVEGMTLVSTLIQTLDNQTIYMPNNMVWGDVITNVTANKTRRVDMTFGIGYGDDVDRTREVLLEVVKAHDKVLEDPAPMVQVASLSDSSVDFIVRPWTRTEDYWSVYWDLTREVKKRLDREGINIPFPQRDVHIHHHQDELRPQPGPERAQAEKHDAAPSKGSGVTS